jgi:hypothetical protein
MNVNMAPVRAVTAEDANNSDRIDSTDEDRQAGDMPGQPPLNRESRVLTEGNSSRLSQLNCARRELRAMGVRIVSVTWVDPCPLVQIERDPNVSLTPLLNRMGPRAFRHTGDYTRVTGEFVGVMLCWYESRLAPADDTRPTTRSPATR